MDLTMNKLGVVRRLETIKVKAEALSDNRVSELSDEILNKIRDLSTKGVASKYAEIMPSLARMTQLCDGVDKLPAYAEILDLIADIRRIMEEVSA